MHCTKQRQSYCCYQPCCVPASCVWPSICMFKILSDEYVNRTILLLSRLECLSYCNANKLSCPYCLIYQGWRFDSDTVAAKVECTKSRWLWTLLLLAEVLRSTHSVNCLKHVPERPTFSARKWRLYKLQSLRNTLTATDWYACVSKKQSLLHKRKRPK